MLCSPRRAFDDFDSLVELHANDTGNTGVLHGDAVQSIRRLHRQLVVCNENELRVFCKPPDHAHETPDILIVERSIHLIEDAEGARLDKVDAKQERDRRKGFLASGK